MKKRFLSTLLALCIVLALLPGTALAANKSGTYGNLEWTLNSSGTLTISGNGGMPNQENHEQLFPARVPWYPLRNSIKTAVVKNGVENVGDLAFYRCRNLTRITLPASIQNIGFAAFEGCGKLTSISMPANLTWINSRAFKDCAGLTKITIPGKVEAIANSAFSGCSRLAGVSMPASIAHIGSFAFEDCVKLARVTFRLEWRLCRSMSFGAAPA